MAPKKGHGPRGGAGAPKNSPAKPDDEYIVFSNAKDKPKKANAGQQQSENKGKHAVAAEEQPKKPDTKTLIGGASWTGKLPVNLLSERCQKNKWEKPEYTMSKNAEGYSSAVILAATNPKTRERIVLPPFKLPPSHKHLAVCESAVEARHFAATYALFRISSMLNIHMMLPPKYKDFWKGEFAQLKQEDVKEGRGWMYAADPFAAQIEREEAKAAMAKKREENEKRKAQEIVSLPTAGGSPNRGVTGGLKGWQRVPRIELGKNVRLNIEELVRSNELWNPYGKEISSSARVEILRELTGLGFRRSHVEEALSICKDREESLEWLLIHVPEDDLPPWSFPEGYTAGISLASNDLAREAKLKRLAAAGYSPDMCLRALDLSHGEEGAAAEYLQTTLLGSRPDATPSSESSSEQWLEEQATLEAIFGERYQASSFVVCHIKSETEATQRAFTFQFRKPSVPYPGHPPILAVLSRDLPAYIRLSITRKALEHATENFLGEQMIFNMVDWLEANVQDIIESPGSLRDIMAIPKDQRTETRSHKSAMSFRTREKKPANPRPGDEQSQKLLTDWQKRQSTPAQQKMVQVRQSLPAWTFKDAIIQAVNTHQVTIISGETGSGKSTQAVQFILDDLIGKNLGSNANIVCTQPRRISALSLADRVSDERCGKVGDEIGYVIRGDSKIRAGTTKITFMTTGVLLRQLQSSQADGTAAALADVSHVCIDEVHERSLDTDYLLNLLRDIMAAQKSLKVILMSATLDAEAFIKYFGGERSVGLVEIPGRTFPVRDQYLDEIVRMTGFQPASRDRYDDDLEGPAEQPEQSVGQLVRSVGMGINYDLILASVLHIDGELRDQPGGILIFLPGTMEIDRCLTAIRQLPNMHALPLHASLLPTEQRRVFDSPPRGKRKIIAATNVAETSITIDDIVAVIDTGRVKETSYDSKDNMVRLQEVWASQAACKQRRGRAGRVRAGTCYKLYTRAVEASMAPRPEPEIRRVPLEQLCLSVKAMGGDREVSQFLARTLTPPEAGAVDGALELLHRMGALDSSQLTALGRHLSMIPADLRCAKLMVYGSIFGAVEATLTIAAILTVKGPFVSPRDKRDEAKAARSSFPTADGDLLLDLAAYRDWSARMERDGYRQTQAWCSANFLSSQTLRDISSNRAQFISSLKDAGILPIDYDSRNMVKSVHLNGQDGNSQLLRGLIAGALSPQIARIEFPDKKFAASISGAVELDPEARMIKYFNQENGRVFVHPSSILFDAQGFSGAAVYISYFTKMATSKVFVRDLTPFSAYGALLFSGPIAVDTFGRGLTVDGWLRLRGWARIGVLISRLRMLLDDLLAWKIEDPSLDLGDHRVISIVRKLVELNGMDQ